MSDEFERTYFEVWGEMPLITDDQFTDADGEEPPPGPAPGPGSPEAADRGKPTPRPTPGSGSPPGAAEQAAPGTARGTGPRPPQAADLPPQAVTGRPNPELAAQAELDRKANEVIQRMMVDTLRRVEARLVLMEEHRDDFRSTVPAAIQELCEQLTKLSDEIGRSLQRTRKINEELAGIQFESAKNLELIAKKVKELESRPRHWPPR